MVLVDNGLKPVVWLYRVRDNGLLKMANVEIVDHNTDYCLNIIWYVRFSFSLTLQVSFKPYLLFFSLCTISQNIRRDSSFTYFIIIFCSMVHFRYVVHFCCMVLPEVVHRVSVSFLFFFLSSESDPAVDRLWIFLPDPDCKLLDCGWDPRINQDPDPLCQEFLCL